MLTLMWFSHAKKSGFTLIEVLITVTIISILAGFIVISLNITQRLQATQDRARIELAREVRNAIVTYYSENGRYPNGLRREERPVCRYGALVTPACLNLDELVRKGFIEDIPADKEAVDPDSGLVAWLDENDNVVVRSAIARPKISTETPLVKVDHDLTPLPHVYNQAITTIADEDTGQHVKLILPVRTDTAWPIEENLYSTSDEAFPQIDTNNPPREGFENTTANIAVTATGASRCEVLPPFSTNDCNINGFAIETDTIHVSNKFSITTPEIGQSNQLPTYHWQIKRISDINGAGFSDSISDGIWDGDTLYFTASDPTKKKRYIYKADSNSVTQVTRIHTTGSGDVVHLLGIFDGNLYYSGWDNDTYPYISRLYRIVNGSVEQLTDIRQTPSGTTSLNHDVSGSTFLRLGDDFYFTNQIAGSNQWAIFRTDGNRVIQITEYGRFSMLNIIDTNYIYLRENSTGHVYRLNKQEIELIFPFTANTITKKQYDASDIIYIGSSENTGLFELRPDQKKIIKIHDDPLMAIAVANEDTLNDGTVVRRDSSFGGLEFIKKNEIVTATNVGSMGQGRNWVISNGEYAYYVDDGLSEGNPHLFRTDGTFVEDVGSIEGIIANIDPDYIGSQVIVDGTLVLTIQKSFLAFQGGSRWYQLVNDQLIQLSQINPNISGDAIQMIPVRAADGTFTKNTNMIFFTAQDSSGRQKLYKMSLIK